MYIGIALQRLSGNFGQTENNTLVDIKCQEDLFLRANQKLLLERDEEKAEKAAKKVAKKVKEAAKAEKKVRKIEAVPTSLYGFLSKGRGGRDGGEFETGSVNRVNQDIGTADIAAITRAAALRGLTGRESEEEATAKMVANMKEFIRSNLQAALAEHINGKVASGKVSEAFIKGSGEDLLKLFGSQEELASFMASMEAELGLEDREITQVVEVQGIDPVQSAAPSIRANDQVHEVPASMEGLQADVARLNEKFGK